jgi:glycosyltransferase involved in cell wall biosynthesis
MRIILATTSLPQGRRNGGEIATMNFIDGLEALGHEVHVVGYARSGTDVPAGPRLHSAGPWRIELAEAGWRRHAWVLRALATGRPVVNAKFMSRSYRQALQSAHPETADLLIIDHAHMGWVMDLPGMPERKIHLAHNAEAALYGSVGIDARQPMRALFAREARCLARLEKRLVRETQQTWCLTHQDRETLSALETSGDFRVFALPGQPFPAAGALPEKNRDLGMIGTWNWHINRQGAEWFIAKVLPLLPTDVKVHIAGSGSLSLAGNDRRLEREGRVPDAARFMRSCRVLLVPAVAGSGVQLKSIEGLALGVPMAATSLALRGLGPVPRYVQSGETPEAFAQAITRAWAESRSPCAEAARGQEFACTRLTDFQNQLAGAVAALPQPAASAPRRTQLRNRGQRAA